MEQVTIVFYDDPSCPNHPNAIGKEMVFCLPRNALLIENTPIKHMLDDDEENTNEIRLPNNTRLIKMQYVEKVFEFLRLNYDDPVENIKLKDNLLACFTCKNPSQYVALIGQDILEIHDFLAAASWLGYSKLVTMLLCVLKFLCLQKTAEEMEAILAPRFPIKYTLEQVANMLSNSTATAE